jgi:hypothetical protein
LLLLLLAMAMLNCCQRNWQKDRERLIPSSAVCVWYC